MIQQHAALLRRSVVLRDVRERLDRVAPAGKQNGDVLLPYSHFGRKVWYVCPSITGGV